MDTVKTKFGADVVIDRSVTSVPEFAKDANKKYNLVFDSSGKYGLPRMYEARK